jgi:hypothetical protein
VEPSRLSSLSRGDLSVIGMFRRFTNRQRAIIPAGFGNFICPGTLPTCSKLLSRTAAANTTAAQVQSQSGLSPIPAGGQYTRGFAQNKVNVKLRCYDKSGADLMRRRLYRINKATAPMPNNKMGLDREKMYSG